MRRITYTEVDQVEIDGAKFSLCPVPYQKWLELRLRGRRAFLRAQRSALLALKAAGNEAPAPAEISAEALLDPTYQHEYHAALRETVAWGVRGHEGLEGVTFAATEREYFGRKYSGASDETVAAYGDFLVAGGASLLEALYLEISRKNSLAPEQKKSSSPPSEPSPAGGAAATA